MSDVIAEVKDTASSNITLEEILNTVQPKDIAIAVCGGPEKTEGELASAAQPYVDRILTWGGEESRGVLNVTTVWATPLQVTKDGVDKDVVALRDPMGTPKYLAAELRLQLNIGDDFIIVRSKTDEVGVSVK